MSIELKAFNSKHPAEQLTEKRDLEKPAVREFIYRLKNNKIIQKFSFNQRDLSDIIKFTQILSALKCMSNTLTSLSLSNIAQPAPLPRLIAKMDNLKHLKLDGCFSLVYPSITKAILEVISKL